MKTLIALGVLAVLITAADGAAQTTYTLTEVVPPGVNVAVFAWSMNSSGAVAVTSQESSSIAAPWAIGPAGTVPLQFLPGADRALPLQLFDNGRAAGGTGSAWNMLRPVMWSASGAAIELRRPTGHNAGVVYSGNGDSWLVGYTSPQDGVLDRPALWISGVLVPLDVPNGFTHGDAYDINASGRIVGAAWTGAGSVIEGWTRDGLAPPVAIGQIPGHYSNSLSAINSQGDAVGMSYDGNGTYYGLRWTAGNLSIIAPPPTFDGLFLADINRIGQVVGAAGSSFKKAVILEGAQPVLLEELLDPVSGAGWQLQVALQINNSGQIVCSGSNPSGKASACVLTPSSLPLVGGPMGNRTAAERRSRRQVAECSPETPDPKIRLFQRLTQR